MLQVKHTETKSQAVRTPSTFVHWIYNAGKIEPRRAWVWWMRCIPRTSSIGLYAQIMYNAGASTQNACAPCLRLIAVETPSGYPFPAPDSWAMSAWWTIRSSPLFSHRLFEQMNNSNIPAAATPRPLLYNQNVYTASRIAFYFWIDNRTWCYLWGRRESPGWVVYNFASRCCSGFVSSGALQRSSGGEAAVSRRGQRSLAVCLSGFQCSIDDFLRTEFAVRQQNLDGVLYAPSLLARS